MERYRTIKLCTWILAATVLFMIGWVLRHGHSIFGTLEHHWERTIREEEQQMRNSSAFEFLSTTDKLQYKACALKAIKAQIQRGKSLVHGTCQFMDGSERAPVALVSFQGSGNTWMRGLLEQATGICTGSTYCDDALRIGGFIGESVDSGVVVVVKTHNFHTLPKWTTQNKSIRVKKVNAFAQTYCYSSTILIIRNPYHALVADWHRESHMTVIQDGSEHTGVVGPKNFGYNNQWSTFVRKEIPNWKAFFDNWLIPSNKWHHPILVVKYEDLKRDKVGVMKKVLAFLNMSHPFKNDEELREKLEMDYDSFKRKKWNEDEFEHFTSLQKKLVNSVIRRTELDLIENNDGNTFGIEEYLN